MTNDVTDPARPRRDWEAPLACTVRGCGRPLTEGARNWTCERGHAFDRARSGYVNLLQPQDRRSPDAGDTADAVAARVRVLEAGVGRQIIDAVAERAEQAVYDLHLEPHSRRGAASGGRVQDRTAPVVVELGCGGGDVLMTVAAALRGLAIGIDLSVPAIDRAARTYREATWVVANADRGVPVLDQAVDLMLSFNGRRNPAECARTLSPTGHLIVVVPAADDFVELRQAVLGEAVREDRTVAVLAEHAAGFTLVDRRVVRERHTLTGARLRDALQGTYRGVRASQRAAVEALDALDVTVASEILVFAPGRVAGSHGKLAVQPRVRP